MGYSSQTLVLPQPPTTGHLSGPQQRGRRTQESYMASPVSLPAPTELDDTGDSGDGPDAI